MMVMGRPTKYKKEMLKEIIKLMKVGASKIEVCAKLEISYETLLRWSNPESEFYVEEFCESIKKGELLSQCWWEKLGRTKTEETKFNSTLWFMNMKNRFRKSAAPWSDAKEIEHTGDAFKNTTDEEIDNKIKAKMAKLADGDDTK